MHDIRISNHKEKQKECPTEINNSQNYGFCGVETSSSNEFRNHIKIKHTPNFNYELCDFQGSSKIILIKHMNLKHRHPSGQESGTFKCTLCENQYSSNWNLNNHTRDDHGRTKICRCFKGGSC